MASSSSAQPTAAAVAVASLIPPPPPVPAIEATAAALATDDACNGVEHVELWGSLIIPGTSNLQPSVVACCASCRGFEPELDVLNGAQCNAWVWHPETRACWLKSQKPDELARSAASLAQRRAAGSKSATPWTSGVVLTIKPCTECIVPTTYTGCISKDKCNTSRACGSPAIDGYSQVDSHCVAASPTARRYLALLEEGAHLVGHTELGGDYDGLGVRWGIGHTKQTWQECEQACRDHRPSSKGGGAFGTLPCNIWTWCSRPKCFEPDAHQHSFGDCWLKFSELPEAPEVNWRDPSRMRPAYLRRHKKEVSDGCPWVSGALLPQEVPMGNGTWGPRAYW